VSWHFLQGQEEASWEGASLDGAPSALSSLMPTPVGSCCRVSETGTSNGSLSGTMCAPSTADPGPGTLTSSAEGSPAPTSAPQAGAPASTASNLASGERWRGSFARYDRATRSWKTAQFSLLGGLDEFSETWPRWGSMRDGACSELPMSARLTSEIESGSLLPTPTASSYGSNQGGSAGRVGPVRLSLQTMATRAVWPTPVSADCGRGSGTYARGNLTLTGAVKWQTPTAQDASRDRHNQRDGSVTLSLLGQARLWPTPTASLGAKGGLVKPSNARVRGNLAEGLSLRTWPTPQARDGDEKRGMPSPGLAKRRLNAGKSNLEDAISASGPATQPRALNPDWVELLMGWPRSWTMVPPPGQMDGKTARRVPSSRRKSVTGRPASKPSETDRSRNARRSRGGC